MKKFILIFSLILSSNIFAMKNGVVKFYNEPKAFGLIKEELSDNGFSHAEVKVVIEITKNEFLDFSTRQNRLVKNTLYIEDDFLEESSRKEEIAAMERMIQALLVEGFNDSDVEVIMGILKEGGGRHTPFHNKGINQAGIKRNSEILEKELQKGKKGLNAVNVK